MTRRDADEILRQEFNQWAAAGKGEEMEQHHISIAEQTIRKMELKPGERVLDLGCGVGWATRIVARLVADGPEGGGQVVGLDVAARVTFDAERLEERLLRPEEAHGEKDELRGQHFLGARNVLRDELALVVLRPFHLHGVDGADVAVAGARRDHPRISLDGALR